MKVLQVNNLYNSGSTGKITYDIHKSLEAEGIESVVCYGRGSKTTDMNVYKICGEFYSHVEHFRANITGMMYAGCHLSTNKLIKVIKKEKPDIVHLQCINGYFVNIFKLLQWLKQNNIPTVLTLHAEFMYTANCGYALECDKWKSGCGNCPRFKKETKSYFWDNTHKSWEKMKSSFDGFNNLTVVSVSPWLMDRAKQSPMLFDKNHVVVLNGLDTEVFHNYDTSELRKSMHIEVNTKIIFHATPGFSMNPSNIKGGYYVVELAKKLLDEDVKIVVAGNYDESISYPSNMLMLGNIQDQQKLAQLYSMADVTLLTSKKETFSMVTAESLCCGTPVVGFEAGAPEKISIREYSEFVEYGDVDALCEAIKKMWNVENKETIEKIAIEKYSSYRMVNEYVKCYESRMEEKL